MTDPSVPTWAFVAMSGLFNLILGLMLMRLWKSVDDNTTAVTQLSIAIPQTYATKDESNRHTDEDERRFNDLHQRVESAGSRIHGLDLRITAIDGSVQQARAGLRGE